MNSYRPPDKEPPVTWREMFAMMRVILEILAGPMAIILGALALLILLFYAGSVNMLYTLPILGALGLGFAYLARRSKAAEQEALKEIEAGRMPKAGRRPPPSGGF